MTLQELLLIKKVLRGDNYNAVEYTDAKRIVDREIKLKSTNYVTGKPLEKTNELDK